MASIATPGNMVVPLSAILDQLQGKLTTSEIDALLQAIVGGRRQQVAPGDLITADLINQILRDLADLNVRMSQLEGTTGGPMILGRVPSGDVPVLSRMTVLGTGFDADRSRNTVLLGGVSITSFFPESSETQLVFQIPDLFTGLPRLVEMSAQAGGRTSNAIQVRLQPRAQTQSGTVVIIPRTEPLGEIQVGQTYTLRWRVTGQTSLPATYRFRLVFTGASGAPVSDWESNSSVTPSEQQLSLGGQANVTATVEIPTGATQAQVALEVRSTDGTITRTSDPLALVVGDEAVISDPRARISLPTEIETDLSGTPLPLRPARITAGGVDLDGIQVGFGQTVDIPFDLFVTDVASAAGDYAYSAEVENAGSAWAVEDLAPEGDTGVARGTQRTITVTLRNAEPSSSTAVRYMVVRASHRPTATAPVDFVSFIRFPIQGYNA